MLPLMLAMCCAIAGNVHAISGAPLANVHIELRGTATARTQTDAAGNFSLTARPTPWTDASRSSRNASGPRAR